MPWHTLFSGYSTYRVQSFYLGLRDFFLPIDADFRGSSQLMKNILYVVKVCRRDTISWPSVAMMTIASFSQAAPAVTGPNPGAAGMTGELCQKPRSVTRSSGRISRTLSCLPSILPLPIIVNQSGGVSAGVAVQQAIARAAGCGEQHAAARLPATTHQHRGPPGAPLERMPSAGCHN